MDLPSELSPIVHFSGLTDADNRFFLVLILRLSVQALLLLLLLHTLDTRGKVVLEIADSE